VLLKFDSGFAMNYRVSNYTLLFRPFRVDKSETMTKKTTLRQKFQDKRVELSSAFRAKASQVISQKIIQTKQWQQAEIIHIYVSLRYEVSTDLIVKHALSDGKIVVCPTQKPGSVSENYVVKTAADFQKIQQSDGKKLELWNKQKHGKINLILLPLVAFDECGNRLGYGSGWYDQFCTKNPSATKIGLAFSAQKAGRIPSEKYDVRLDGVLTDKNYFCL